MPRGRRGAAATTTAIPTGRIRRTAQVGSVVGSQGARYAGTRAAQSRALDPEEAAEALERRHLEAAERMVETLGRMKGAAMKIGQLASFIDTEFLPPEYRELYQEQLATLRTTGAADAVEEGAQGARRGVGGARARSCSRTSSEDAAAAASIGQVHRAVLPDGRRVAVKIQYPGVAAAIAADMQNAGLILRLAKALAPGLDAKAAAEELRERVMEELDYELEAQNQRAFARGYRGHPFIHVPDVVTRLSTAARAGERVGRRRRLRGGQASCPRPSATASARSSSASASARSTTSSTSTPTPTPGTTC